jgi:hypothetical protein
VVNGIVGNDVLNVLDGFGGDTANGGPSTTGDTCVAEGTDVKLSCEL